MAIGLLNTKIHSCSLPSLGSSSAYLSGLCVTSCFHCIVLLHSNFTPVFLFLPVLHLLILFVTLFPPQFLLSYKQLPVRFSFEASFLVNLDVFTKSLTFIPFRVSWSHGINFEKRPWPLIINLWKVFLTD